MVRRQLLPDDLSPAQVVALQDALLANADRLLRAALTALNAEDAPLARSLAILGMEESGKAIALHERRVMMAYVPEGEAFVDQQLRDLWGQHVRKLDAVHHFLVNEEYWFDTIPADPEENAKVLGTIDEWRQNHNAYKQRGFYVDVSLEGDPITPEQAADSDAVRAVIGHVHQIGWQLRLGEHIEGKSQRDHARDVPPATEEDIEYMRSLMRSWDPEIVEGIIASKRAGTKGKKLNNEAYGFTLPTNPFENVGRPGYEAQDRELFALMEQVDVEQSEEKPEPAGRGPRADVP